ncbi:MAG TPA: hypothetical protein VGN34_23855, partial [Ktedonobacteraceae bacterium]
MGDLEYSQSIIEPAGLNASTQESYTLKEILTQPAAWQAALQIVADKQTTLRNLWDAGQFSDIL